MAHFIAILLDEKRLDALKGTGLEEKISDLFGGALKALNIEVPEEAEKGIMEAFTNLLVKRYLIVSWPGLMR